MSQANACRLCFSADDNDYLNIFSTTGNELRINEVISEHFKCDISESDSMPNVVCRVCWTTTESFHELYEKSKLAQEAFLISIIKTEADPIVLYPESTENDFGVDDIILEPKSGEQDSLEPDILQSNALLPDVFEQDAAESNAKSSVSDTASVEKLPNRQCNENAKKKRERLSKKHYEITYRKLFNENKHRLNLSCDKCTVKFETLEDAQQHYPAAHKIAKGYIRCTNGKCKIKLNYPCEVVEHLKRHLEPEQFTCKQCNRVLNSRHGLISHMKIHDETEIKAKRKAITKYNVLDGLTLKGSERDNNPSARFIAENFDMTCDLCETSFVSFSEARNHYKDVHNEKNGYVKCCNVKLKELWMVTDHISSHLNPNAFSCDICKKSFSSKPRLNQHMWHHRRKYAEKFTCDICGKSFRAKATVLLHLFTFHVDSEGKFECEICHKRFGLDSLLQRHMYARHNKKILTCEFCGKTYSDKTHFNTHVQTHLDISERVFQPRPCEHCGDWLMSKSGLYYHEQIHKIDVQKCEHCELELPNRIAYRAHVSRYHRAPKHKCKFCDRTFTMGKLLKSHEETHTRHRTYPCQFCAKIFRVRTSKITHEWRTHPEEREQFRKMKELNKKKLPTT